MTMTVMVAISGPALPRRKKNKQKTPLMPHFVAAYMVMMMFTWGCSQSYQ